MKKIVLSLVAAFVCVASATAIRAINVTTNSPIAELLPANITRSPVQTGNKVMRVPSQARTLSFAERVTYQRAIEEVYWRHRIWPKERHDSKPPLDAVMTQGQLEEKAEESLRNSKALEDYWQRPITAEQLQAEMDRMVEHTKQPEVLQELFEALGNDPFVIAECLARPVLAERLLTNSYAYDERIHGELKQRAKADLQAYDSIEQMRRLSGRYSRIEFVKSDNSQEVSSHDADHAVKLDSHEWDQNVQRLVATFKKSGAVEDYESVPVGKLSSLQEDENRFYTTAVIEKDKDRLKVATVAWQKQPLVSWLATVEEQVPTTMAVASAKYTLPNVSDSATCTDNTWTATSDVPVSGPFHTAVWTGSEMIVWGAFQNANGAMLNTGGRYNPSIDSWVATSTANAPTARFEHTAVWSGTEMIVWGGADDTVLGLNTGGRYNPSTNSWVATSTTNAPTARKFHTVVWTGTEMIVFGGGDANSRDTNTGGRYDPSTNAWNATSTVNAAGRSFHTAIWSGSEMIVWGGEDTNGNPSNTGGRYNPTTDSWTITSMTNVPSGRASHTAVWTGSEMIIWGGSNGNEFDTGGRYSPSMDSWTATSTVNAPGPRTAHTAVWTGSEMVIWGGQQPAPLNTGGRYNPNTDSWTATSVINAPPANPFGYTAVWSGTEMIVWDGSTGGRYNFSMDSWVGTGNPPTPRTGHSAVWTGAEMIVWGGQDDFFSLTNTGARYHPSTDSWTAISNVNAPTNREFHTAVWTGSEMIVWGGVGLVNTTNILFNTGGRYNPATDSWIATNTGNAPAARWHHSAVWTGGEMIVWGGNDGFNLVNTGSRFNPGTNSWTATNTANAPSPRHSHTAVWTGSEMIVWGGIGGNRTGGKYDPDNNSWIPTSTTDAPAARYAHAAVWTGSEMIVWGGFNVNGLNTGGRYNPSADSWTATTLANAPSGRGAPTAIWSGSEMIVWGGSESPGCMFNSCPTNTGGRYNPSIDFWSDTSVTNAPSERSNHTAVWTGNEMIVWGGDASGTFLNTGGRYCATSAGSQLGNISTRAFVQTGDNVMIGGFIVEGATPKRVIIRAIGPELSRYGVPDVLADPMLELHDGTGALIGSNNDWQHTIIGGIITSNQVQEIQNSFHAPTDRRESAIIADLPAGNYTAIVRGVSNSIGVALAEVYDLSGTSGSFLGNISTRSFVQTDNNVMIGGFIVQGSQAKRVIVRAIGPELSAPPFNVPDALANPTLELHDTTGALIARNDNWVQTIIGGIITSDQAAAIRASGHAPTDARESAIIGDLPPGNYTAILRGVNNTTGVALVEVYDLGP